MKFSEYNFLQTLGENYWEILFALERRKHQKEIDPCLLSKFKNIERLKSSKFMPFEGPSEDSDGILELRGSGTIQKIQKIFRFIF